MFTTLLLILLMILFVFLHFFPQQRTIQKQTPRILAICFHTMPVRYRSLTLPTAVTYSFSSFTNAFFSPSLVSFFAISYYFFLPFLTHHFLHPPYYHWIALVFRFVLILQLLDHFTILCCNSEQFAMLTYPFDYFNSVCLFFNYNFTV